MKPRLLLSILLLIGIGLVTACQRTFNLEPVAATNFTVTPTFTFSPIFTQTFTFTPTNTYTPSPVFTSSPTFTFSPVFTSTPTFTFSPVFTASPTFTFSITPTLTNTNTPTNSPTPTPTATPTLPVICTMTPVATALYTEMELPADGGGTGTNDSCGTAENIGTVSSGTPLVISGILSSAGTNNFSGDYDYYQFTAGSAGAYTLTVDCFSTGSDSNLLDIVIFDSTCAYVNDPGAVQPVVTTTSPPLNPGDVYYFLITAYNGTAPIPYHFTISPP